MQFAQVRLAYGKHDKGHHFGKPLNYYCKSRFSFLLLHTRSANHKSYCALVSRVFTDLFQVFLVYTLTIISSMRVWVDSIPLRYQQPGWPKRRFPFFKKTIVDVSRSFVHYQVSCGSRPSLDGNIPHCSFLSNVNITPEWTEDMTLSCRKVVSWVAIGVGKSPRRIERERSIFIHLV